MRFLAAVGVFLLAALFIILGIAQRTIFLGPDSLELQTTVPKQSAALVIDSHVLNSFPNRQRLNIDADGQIIAVTGRTSDIQAWLTDTEYSTLQFNERTETLTTRLVAGAENTLPNPVGSDLWFDEYSAFQNLRFAVDIPDDYSLMITTDVGEPGLLGEVKLTWTLDNSTPWAGPFFLLGGILVAIGILLLVLAIRDFRKKRGPRRKNPRELQNKKSLVRGFKKDAIAQAPKKGRRKAPKALTFGAALTVSTLLVTGCSPSYWPQFPADGTETPTTTSTTPAPELEIIQPSLSVLQFERVISRISLSIIAADEALDPELAAERVDLGALTTRKAAYTLAKADSNNTLPAGVDPESVKLFLPQQTAGWPRSFMVVSDVPNGESAFPQLQYFTQATPRENYKLVYQVNLVQDLPEVSAAAQGSATVPDDSKLLPFTKLQVFENYAQIMLNGDSANEAGIFETEGDVLLEKFGKAYKDARIKAMPKYSKLEFGDALSTMPIVGFWTKNSGAIVLGSITETETVTPTEKGATVSPSGKAKILLGKDKSSTGIVVTYLQQVLFYVPPLTETDGKVRLIGYSQNIISAVEK
ncbi:MAG: hypothetical protein WBA28_02595 [Microbacteriaceae bacterium]